MQLNFRLIVLVTLKGDFGIDEELGLQWSHFNGCRTLKWMA